MANEFNINIGQKTSWTRAIEAAAGRHEAGTVAVLAATGMQTTSWSNVSPENLFHIISALKQVGLEPEARMVAAEALTRA
jgi:UDP-N-acetylglucosamine enolpyruvyl transferase